MQKLLDEYDSTRLVSGISLAELIRRPELAYDKLAPIDKERPELSEEVREEVNINLKYEGYIKRQKNKLSNSISWRVRRFLRILIMKILKVFDWKQFKSYRIFARSQLDRQQESVVFLHPIFPCLQYT